MNIQALKFSKTPTLPAGLYITPSRCWMRCLVLLHTIVLLAILNANLATYAQLLLSLWVLTCLLIHTLFWCWQPIYQVRYLHRGWWLIVKGQADRRYLIVDCYFWSPFLLMLLVENGQGKRKLLPIVFDSCSVDGFRWLRVTTRLIIDASR